GGGAGWVGRWEQAGHQARRRPAVAAVAAVCVLAAVVVMVGLSIANVRVGRALEVERNANARLREVLLENARLTTSALSVTNEWYAEQIVERLRARGVS